MSSNLDNAFMIGVESTYGTPVALTRAYEAQSDGWKRSQEALESVGMRAGQHTLRSDRRRQINMGAAGEVEMDFMDRGMGVLLQSLLGASPAPTLVTTGAYTTTLTSDTTGGTKSYTAQMLRAKNDGTLQAFTYHGAVFTGFDLEQSLGNFLKLKLKFDAEDEDTSTAAGTPSYPTGATPFDWTQAVVQIDAAPVDVTSFKLSGDLGFKTDRRFLRGSALKKVPVRAALPQFTGELELEFADTTQYAKYVAGTIFSLTATWTGGLIVAGHNFTVTVSAPACQFDGDTPEASLDDMTMATMPFRVLHNGTNPALTITLKNGDAAL